MKVNEATINNLRSVLSAYVEKNGVVSKTATLSLNCSYSSCSGSCKSSCAGSHSCYGASGRWNTDPEA